MTEMDISITINKSGFDKTKAAALKEGEASGSEEKEYYYPDAQLTTDEFYIDDKEIIISGETTNPKGYISITIPLTVDFRKELIEYQVKTLNKLKTVLEALK